MRIGYLSTFEHHWNTESELADHLELAGHTVDRYQYNRFDHAKFLAQDFDLVLTALPQCIEPEFWAKVKAPKVAWYFDLVFGWQGREKKYLPSLKHFDLVISTDGYEDRYAEHGIKRVWMPHGFDARKYHPVDVDESFDAAFIGHTYTDSRRALLRGLKRFGLKMFGEKDDCWGSRYAEICNSAKIIVCDNAVNDIPGYWSDRVYLSMGSGAFVLHPDVPGIETQFTPGKHFDLWHDEAELHDKIRHYLAHDEERKAIARAGCEHAHKYHTMTQRAEGFNRILESACADTAISSRVSGSSSGSCSTTSKPIHSFQSMRG
jgi:spore maturation protein CgeB